MTYKGYTVRYKGVWPFFVTNRTRKTRGLARDICRALQIPDNPGTIAEILYSGRFATAEVREKDLEIRGDGFGGYGNFWNEYEQRGVKPPYFIDSGG
jgi:hypothetical protein